MTFSPLALPLALGALAVGAPVALAADPHEPNDTHNTATGPIGTDDAHALYAGDLVDGSDRDRYRLWVPPARRRRALRSSTTATTASAATRRSTSRTPTGR